MLQKNSFSRDRKITLPNLVGLILQQNSDNSRSGLAINSQLYFDSSCAPNKQSFSEARQKLSWEFFRDLFAFVASNVPSKTWKTHPVRIIDGTRARVPFTRALYDEYGSSESQHGLSHYPTMHLVLMTEAFSGLPLALEIDKYKSSERTLAARIFAKLQSNDLLLLDRGLGGRDIYESLCKQGIFFIHRSLTGYGALAAIKEFVLSGASSMAFELKIKGQIKPLQLRAVRGKARQGGEPFVYVTNLMDAKLYSSDDINALYRERWQVETSIGHLKNTLGLEKIKSKTKTSVLQDIYACLIVLALSIKAKLEATRRSNLNLEKDLSIKFAIYLLKDRWKQLLSPTSFKQTWKKICCRLKSIVWVKQRGRKCPRFSYQPQNRWTQERSYLKNGTKKKNSRSS